MSKWAAPATLFLSCPLSESEGRRWKKQFSYEMTKNFQSLKGPMAGGRFKSPGKSPKRQNSGRRRSAGGGGSQAGGGGGGAAANIRVAVRVR